MSSLDTRERRVFIDSTMCTLDAQRRILMPKEWRLASDTGTTEFYIMPEFPNVINVFDTEHFNKYYDRINNLQTDEDVRWGQTICGSLISRVVPDRQGRFTISQALIDFGQLAPEGEKNCKIVLVGAITFGRIVSESLWVKNGKNYMNLVAYEKALAEKIRQDQLKALL